MISNDKNIAEVRQLCLDQAFDVRRWNVLTTRCDDQICVKNVTNELLILTIDCTQGNSFTTVLSSDSVM